MYRPHEAREDTVLFPALRRMLPEKQMKEIAEQMEKSEDMVLGDEGFEKAVDQVAGVEKQLGIYELDQFTPKVSGKKGATKPAGGPRRQARAFGPHPLLGAAGRRPVLKWLPNGCILCRWTV